MAQKLNSGIGFDEKAKAVCVICGGKIGFAIQESDDKENPYICIDLAELKENVGVGGVTNDIERLENKPFVRIIAYDPQSITSIVRALMRAQHRLFEIKK